MPHPIRPSSSVAGAARRRDFRCRCSIPCCSRRRPSRTSLPCHLETKPEIPNAPVLEQGGSSSQVAPLIVLSTSEYSARKYLTEKTEQPAPLTELRDGWQWTREFSKFPLARGEYRAYISICRHPSSRFGRSRQFLPLTDEMSHPKSEYILRAEEKTNWAIIQHQRHRSCSSSRDLTLPAAQASRQI